MGALRWISGCRIDRASGDSGEEHSGIETGIGSGRSSCCGEFVMREERGQLAGNQTISDTVELWGSIGGDVTVAEGGKFYLRGAVYGDITVEFRGRIHIFGRVTGSLTVKRGAKAIHSGVLGG